MISVNYSPFSVEGRPERRRIAERRKVTAASVICGGLRGRRRHSRRSNERYGYVDWYEPRLLYLTIAILLSSCADALFTLNLLNRGAVELNVLMAMLIDTNVYLFVALKMALTGSGLIFLVAHAHFRLFRVLKVSRLLYLILSLYMMLIIYEVILLTS